MAIAFSCPSCERAYSVSDRFGGKVTTCKDCPARMVVPDAEAPPEPEAPPPPRPRNAAAADAARYYEEAARKQRRRERLAEERKSAPRVGLSISPTILTGLGGIGLMVLAVVWVGVCFFAFENFNLRSLRGPLVLLVAGFVGLLKGLLGHED